MFSGMSVSSLLLILLIVVLVFGTKKLKSLGSDVGGAVKGFRKAMNDDNDSDKSESTMLSNDASVGETTAQKSEATQNQ